MDDAMKRLIEAAKELVAFVKTAPGRLPERVEIAMAAISAAEQQAADDDEPVTAEWCNSQFEDTSMSTNMRRFEIAPSVRIIFEACVGGWSKPMLWIGAQSNIRMAEIANRRHIRQLVELLRGER